MRSFCSLMSRALFGMAIATVPIQAAETDVEWIVTDGDLMLTFDAGGLADSGITLHGTKSSSDMANLRVAAGGMLSYYNLFLNEFVGATVPLNDSLMFSTPNGTVDLPGLVINVKVNSLTESFNATILDPVEKVTLFDVKNASSEFDVETETVTMHGATVVITSELAKRLDQPALAGVAIGSLELNIHVAWAGQEPPAKNSANEFVATTNSAAGGAPRGAVPDVVYTNCLSIAKYGPIGGIYAYSLASHTCNIGTANLLWGNSHDGTPGLGMNVYRIYDGRLEQIGLSWVKNACCAAAGNGCGLACNGSGGSVLGAGCLDSYGAGYNAGQTRLNSRKSMNPYSGDYLPADGQTGNDIFKRLQVHETDLNAANFPAAQYLVEGVYVASDEAPTGMNFNNASYMLANLTQGTYDMSPSGPMQQGTPAIYAWQDHGLGTNTPDPSVSVQEITVPGEGIYHIASKVTDNGNGTYRYDYALFNLTSDRCAGSFSIPIGGASVSDVGFHDVDYHSGDPFDNTDWSVTVDSTHVTWSSPQTFAENPNSNALRWGTMYNFWFTADLEPNFESGDAVIGLFKPGTPTSITAQVDVPLPGEVVIRLVDGAPSIIPTCQPTDFTVELRDGSETLLPGSGKLHVSYDGGAFNEIALAPLGDDLYTAQLPTPNCGDSPRFYLSAESTEGTFVTNPRDAVGTATFLYAEPGYADILTHLETDFEGGLPAGWTQAGLWTINSTCSAVAGGDCNGSDGSQVAYFGRADTCTFNTGHIENASMTTPQVALPTTTPILLTYCSTIQRDSFPISDWPTVLVTPDGGSPEVVDEPAVGVFMPAPPVWTERVVDLSAYAGQLVTISWNFDNVLPITDDYLGWQVDNISLTAPGVTCIPGCAPQSADANGDDVTDGRDLDGIIAAILLQSTDPGDLAALDLNGDNVVDMLDIDLIVQALLNQ